MNLGVIITIMFILNSCGQPQSVENKTNSMQIKLDSITVKYWKNTEANEYHFQYLDGQIQVSSQYFSNEKIITDTVVINKLLRYLDAFFMTRIEKVEFSRKRSPDPIITDYSSLKFKGFFNGKMVFDEIIQIGEEEYDVKFNPKFIEFYEYLDSLV